MCVYTELYLFFTFLPFISTSDVPELTDSRGERLDFWSSDGFFFRKLMVDLFCGTSTLVMLLVLTLFGRTLPVTEFGMDMVMCAW